MIFPKYFFILHTVPTYRSIILVDEYKGKPIATWSLAMETPGNAINFS